MREKDITICGHGSGTPSTKNMEQYLTTRHNLKATNGKDKGLVCVMRFLPESQQDAFHNYYKTLLGRNIYSQNWRQYVYSPRSDGKYYSDCSSSGCYTYDKCGVKGVRTYNTASMYYNGTKVDVSIENGHIAEADLSKLRVGDALLFRGNDPARPQQIGHVEYIYEIPKETGEWEKLNSGKWVYKKPNGSLAKNEWLVIHNHWYWFGDDNIAVTGYQVINGRRYYFETAGSLECALMHTDDSGALTIWEV